MDSEIDYTKQGNTREMEGSLFFCVYSYVYYKSLPNTFIDVL